MKRTVEDAASDTEHVDGETEHVKVEGRKTALLGDVLTAQKAWFCTRNGALPLRDLLRLCAANCECQHVLQGQLFMDLSQWNFVRDESRARWAQIRMVLNVGLQARVAVAAGKLKLGKEGSSPRCPGRWQDRDATASRIQAQ